MPPLIKNLKGNFDFIIFCFYIYQFLWNINVIVNLGSLLSETWRVSFVLELLGIVAHYVGGLL